MNYVGKAASLYNAGYELNGSVYVISKFIGNTGYGIGFVSAVVLMEAFVTLSHSGSFSCLTHVSMSVECMGWSSTGDTNAYLISRILYILTCMPRLRFVLTWKLIYTLQICRGIFFPLIRDPNLVRTLDNYDGTVEFLCNLQLDDDVLTKAIIGTISDIDSYQLPDAKGYTRYVNWTNEFLYWKSVLFLDLNTFLSPWNAFAQEFSIMVHLIACLCEW